MADFAEVDEVSILDRVVSLPVHSWRYRAELAERRSPRAEVAAMRAALLTSSER